MIFDGDKHREDAVQSINENNELFDVLGETKIKDFPDGKVQENYLGFEYDFNHALELAGFQDVHNESNPDRSPKGLKLFLKAKAQVEDSAVGVPKWIEQIKESVRQLPEEAESVLKQGANGEKLKEYEDLPF